MRSAEIIERINALPPMRARLMEVCGTHTMAIAKAGIKRLLPPGVELVSGPGCPVCVTPPELMDAALELASRPGVTVASYGDMLRVPGTRRGDDLAHRRARGGSVELVYSPMDAVELAKKHPEREVVFLGVGFETTAPGTAASVLAAREQGVGNYSVFPMFRLVEPALRALIGSEGFSVHGFLCPGHVAVVTGSEHFRFLPEEYGLPAVVAVNRFPTDTEAELKLIETKCKELGVNVALSEVWGKGGEGGVELAKEVIRLCEQPNDFTFSYELNCSIKEKIEAIAKKIYHADGVNFTANAEKQIKTLTELGYDHMPICMAKTQYSFTDDQTKLGAPRDFTITVRNVKVSAGAGFLVALTGEIMTMPGLPKVPAAERIDVDETGKISGLF